MDNADLRRAGLKVTVPRLKILEILESAEPHHLSAEDVYRKLMESDESIGKAVVCNSKLSHTGGVRRWVRKARADSRGHLEYH